jgi:hypothetical protein
MLGTGSREMRVVEGREEKRVPLCKDGRRRCLCY